MVISGLDDVKGTGLLIHHWDADGICSARLLLEKLHDKTIENTTPQLGNYFLTSQEISSASGHDFVIIADMALPEDNIHELAKHSAVFIFDHHLQKPITGVFHHNPIITGASAELFPSASWIVNSYLGNPVNVFALLGVIGDHEKRIKENKEMFSHITRLCKTEGYTFDELLEMVYLLDSNYKMGNHTAVVEAPRLLLASSDARQILENVAWKRNLLTLEQEIRKSVDAPGQQNDSVMLKRIHTPYNIISTVTRRVFWNVGKDTVVINSGFFKDRDQLYVRSSRNLEPLIQQGRSFGFRCGGKKEVFGAVVPKESTESFLGEVLKFLS